MQAIQAQVIHTFPVAATEESQADKGIDHPLFTCDTCGTIWRSHGRSRCPSGNCGEGTLMTLDGRQSASLFMAISHIEDECLNYTPQQWPMEFMRFRDFHLEHTPWYDGTNRRLIQACYERMTRALNTEAIASHEKMRQLQFAIAFFKKEYENARDDEKTFCPERAPQRG